MKPNPYAPEVHALLRELPLIHDRLMRAGLVATGQKMHDVVRSIGYEVAEQRGRPNTPEKNT